ncbi:DUF6194 family protein [Catenuloplanes atrovinosus]|uniref:DUF6194 domain-containing protein n=1 Tax=Catenuloplanes atrovinosus TaxID=137266 RepID=A0AAE4C9H5_9ACTN|nr:DUF6194 family protein [Catenuloplanes atrovinosus]MDR7274814.1 hypothetical protein [Catenuloplanes atrovinosus]
MTFGFSPLYALLDARPAPVEVLACGEPTHGEPAFQTLRNELLSGLAARGFRSVALETDRLRARLVDAYVRLRTDADLETVLADGFSHGWGAFPGNRELVVRLREHNHGLPPEERIAFHGFDAPTEVDSAPSPLPYLLRAFDLVGDRIAASRAEIERLAGDDARWSRPDAVLDPARSPGTGADAVALRVIADDLLGALWAAGLTGDVPDAEAALWLLRYHAQAAAPLELGERVTRLIGLRDAWMARNLADVRERERRRGATLVHSHNAHLQRHGASWDAAGWERGDLRLRWNPAGRIAADLFGDRYVFLAGSLGASAALGLGAPADGTFEAALSDGLNVDVTAGDRAGRADAVHGYFPLTAELIADADAIWHVRGAGFDGPGESEIAERIRAMPGVTEFVADEAAGAPPGSNGDRFYFAGVAHRMPFATIVAHDTPGFDEDSRLDRPGVFRLNIALGRAEFARRFGYPPAEAAGHRAGVDFTRAGVIMPHPAYAVQGWAAVLNPPVALLPELDDLLDRARRRASGDRR